jgi:hypothetical protein
MDLGRRAVEIVDQQSQFHGRTDRLQFETNGDVLTVRGVVPSFYLKQLLQTVLRDVDGVRMIDDRVDVVACDGLSSVRK